MVHLSIFSSIFKLGNSLLQRHAAYVSNLNFTSQYRLYLKITIDFEMHI